VPLTKVSFLPRQKKKLAKQLQDKRAKHRLSEYINDALQNAIIPCLAQTF